MQTQFNHCCSMAALRLQKHLPSMNLSFNYFLVFHSKATTQTQCPGKYSWPVAITANCKIWQIRYVNVCYARQMTTKRQTSFMSGALHAKSKLLLETAFFGGAVNYACIVFIHGT